MFTQYNENISLDTLTESGAVFKVAQNTFNKMWHARLPVALGVKSLEDNVPTS